MKRLIFVMATILFVSTAFSQTDKYVSEFHKTHEGQILFCKGSVKDLPSDPVFVDAFNTKDEITACVYLKPNDDLIKFKGKLVVDGAEPGYEIDNQQYKFAFTLYIISDNYGTEGSGFSNYMNFDMKDGKHKITIELWNAKKETIAKGEFTLEKGGASEQPTEKFSSIKAGMVNAALEQQAVKAINAKATSENWTEKYTKAKIVSTSWEIEKNEITGAIICRKIYMKLLGVWPDGKCQAVDMGFRQDYTGGGKYSSTLIYHSIGDMKPVICE